MDKSVYALFGKFKAAELRTNSALHLMRRPVAAAFQRLVQRTFSQRSLHGIVAPMGESSDYTSGRSDFAVWVAFILMTSVPLGFAQALQPNTSQQDSNLLSNPPAVSSAQNDLDSANRALALNPKDLESRERLAMWAKEG
jgi:hypothetical protein